MKIKLKYYLLFIFIVSTLIRFLFNFSQELIPGVNGGYYPLQVRSILFDGQLGFTDMPLLFYIDAFLVKFVSLFGLKITNTLILNIVKLVDCISLPFLLFPLYKIIRFGNSANFLKICILVFSVLSFSPLILTSDLQKNALAITFLICSLAYYFSYQINKKKAEVIIAFIFLLLTALTHFGTFAFGLFFILLLLIHSFKKKALLPISILIALSLGIVFLLDEVRFHRLVTLWKVLFEKPALLHGMVSPPDFVIILFSYTLAIIGIIFLTKRKKDLQPNQKASLFASIVCLLLCSFPLLDGEYFTRLSLFLFIPQILLIHQIAGNMRIKQQKWISTFLLTFTFLSILAVIGHPKEAIIDKNAFNDLKKMKALMKSKNETIVIARHGLEWWTAWALKTKVAQDKSMENVFFDKYKTVIILNQINGFSLERGKTHFHEPYIPENSTIIYSTYYFKAFQINKPE